MSNVHGLYSNRRSDSDEDDEDRDGNDRYVGGVDSRGGGSGLAVQPNPGEGGGGGGDPSRSIFDLASPETAEEKAAAASAGGGGGPTRRRVITMYRDGFVVDDGPYRRLEDPSNAEFLGDLARGVTPRELVEQGNENVTVGLVDKRTEEYVESFRSFSGAGTSLGGGATGGGGGDGGGGVVRPGETAAAPASAGGKPTSIQVRLLSGKRIVAKVSVDDTVHALVSQIESSGQAGTDPYVLMSGFPPRQVTNLDSTISEAGLAGASVTQKKFTG